MKITMKKYLSVIMALVICVNVLFGMNFSTFAADDPVNYVYDGNYIYNWGTRGTTATFLSPNAEEFYIDNGVTLSGLSALAGSSSTDGVPSSALYSSLYDLMSSNHTTQTSYGDTRYLFMYTDCQNSGGQISSFYAGVSVGPEWDEGETWNREHTWPKSKAGYDSVNNSNTNDATDIMSLRPAYSSYNSSRGNTAYGESDGYFLPYNFKDSNLDLRGDVARTMLYVYVRWGGDGNHNTILENMWDLSGVIESKEILLKWMQEDPVDTWELGRNDSVEAITGTRNVFVDYPELAFELFETAVPDNYTSPSGGADIEGTTGGDSGSDDNTTDTPSAESKNIVFELGANGTATHSDGSSKTSYTETVDSYTLNITDGASFYTGARDAKGNSAIKMGTSSKTGSFSMTVPDDVTKVIFNVAGYKAKTVTISVNGTAHSITTASDNGEYTEIEVDTSSTKTITFATGTGYRCMINSITYVVPGSLSEDENKVYVDTDDVVIWGASSAFDEDTVVTAVVITSGDSFDTANTALADMAFKKIYEITATNGGTAVQPDSPLTITFDIPTGYNVDNTYIVYIDENGVIETLETLEKTDTTISAQISHFSTYAVVDTSEVSSGDEGETVEVEATITFNSGSFIETGTTAQVWSENGVTVTTNKGTYSGAFYTTISDHTRWYKGHEIVTEYEYPISKIVFTTTGSSYTTLLANSLTSSGLGTVTSSGTTITLELTTPSKTVTFSHVNNATRVKSMTLTAQKPADGGDTTSPIITAQSNNNSYGTVTVRGTTIFATPNEGYEVSGCEIISGNTNATVTQNGNNFTVETDADVTVQINFAPRTQYTVTFSDLGVTTIATAYGGDTVTLPTLTGTDYIAVGWVAAEIDGETTETQDVKEAGSSYIVTENVTLYALYSRQEAGGSGESDVFTKYTGDITEGDYLITYDNYAMNASISSNRFVQTTVTDVGDSITSPDAAIIWTITADGDYWTLYNESTSSYAAGNGTKNQGKLLASVTDYALWTASGTATYEFVNKGNAAKPVNANLRQNTTYGFACYSTGTGGSLTLYKRTEAAMTTYYFTSAAEAEYTVTANANNAEYGTVTVSSTTIFATPNEGYTVAGYSIASGTATVIQESNNFYVTPTSNVVITINFEALPTYTVTFVENGTKVGTDSTFSGGFIKLPEYSGELDEYTTFDGWAEQENETDSAKIYAAKATFAVTKDVTLYAQFTVTEPEVPEESDHYFVKVTENLTDWSGTYLIVYEEGGVAFNGGLDDLDIASNNTSVTISDEKIAATDGNLAISFTITKNPDGTYSIRSKSGFNIGGKTVEDNGMLTNATKIYNNSISIDDDGNAVIICTYGEINNYLRYNATSGQERFRFYKKSSYASQKPIALYKLDVAKMMGAQVTVDADISLKYHVNVTNVESISASDLVMRFSIDGTVVDTVTGTEYDGKYVFDFAHLAPQRITDVIKAELLYKGTLIDVKDDYSIKANVLAILEKDPSNTNLKRFVSDLLYYGEAAQNYTKYNTDNLATDGLTKGEDGDIYAVDETVVPEASDSVFYLSETTGDAGFKSATVWFDSTNSLIVKVSKKTEDTIVKVYVTPENGTRAELTYNDTLGGYKTADISVTNFDKKYTFELCDENDNVIQTLTYSINSYAYSKQDSENANMAALALALFRLGVSAEKL